jgi:hypothetical protein
MNRAYYSNSIETFLTDDEQKILGELAQSHQFVLEDLQKNAWIKQIKILKQNLHGLTNGHVFFEYSIPRMGKRVDVILILNGIVFVLEFKVGETNYTKHAFDQVLDYSLDLKNFHEQSHNRPIIPILVATEANSNGKVSAIAYEDNIYQPIEANSKNIGRIVTHFGKEIPFSYIDPMVWQNSLYKPTPTIIEAAQALYRGHRVEEISRSDAGAINLSRTSEAILRIIDEAKVQNKKAICFVTGVPGAGKTLAGLNIANARLNVDEEEHAVFLSGNGPLVEVLREALARDEVNTANTLGGRLTKKAALTKARTFIQNIHHFRDDALAVNHAPVEKVVVFDEAQRAWTLEQTSSFMQRKKGVQDFAMSEPEFLISVMDRHKDWAVIICLIGGGQEINTGEAGLPEWFHAIKEYYSNWQVYAATKLSDYEYTRGKALFKLINPHQFHSDDNLHLAVSIRSYRSEKVSHLVKLLLDGEVSQANSLYKEIKPKYPIVITRDIEKAKWWLRKRARGTERYGFLASSGGYRLKPFGINVQIKIGVTNWFLNDKDDVRSSYFLEDVATEFDIQGLELDWTCVAWDADLRYTESGWQSKSFRGTSWQNVNDDTRRLYLKNAYRVLLTRARQGMVIFIPDGNKEDETRKPDFYTGTYDYLKKIGFEEI